MTHTIQATTVSIGSTATGPFREVQPDLRLQDVYVIFHVQKASDLDTRNVQPNLQIRSLC